MIEIAGGKKFPMRAKPCDTCKTKAALLFCLTDSSYMCIDCDSKIHGNDSYERVWMCEVCEQAPSSVTCKADAAALCVMCDWDIHSANPLARRHERVPVTSFYHSAVAIVKSTATAVLEVPVTPESEPNIIGYKNCYKNLCHGHEEDKLSADVQADMKSIEFLFSDPDNLLDFDYPVPNDPVPLYEHHNADAGVDSVVPVQISNKSAPQSSSMMGSADNHFEIDFTTSNISSFSNSYAAPCINQNISSEVGIVVPDGSCMSYPFALQMNNKINTNTGNGQVCVAVDREARVMRYREKRKNRKFEKTVRYASRKAYAETRPRIKGRFVKRTENVQGWFTTVPATKNLMGKSGFGVVPSFLTKT